jgi:hypothetical protein
MSPTAAMVTGPPVAPDAAAGDAPGVAGCAEAELGRTGVVDFAGGLTLVSAVGAGAFEQAANPMAPATPMTAAPARNLTGTWWGLPGPIASISAPRHAGRTEGMIRDVCAAHPPSSGDNHRTWVYLDVVRRSHPAPKIRNGVRGFRPGT